MCVTMGGRVGRTKVALRLFSENLDPELVTSLLGRQPTNAWRAGTFLFNRPTKLGMWSLDSESSDDLDTQIKNILASLSSDMNVWNELTKQHRADFFCGLFLTSDNEGLTLTPATMAAISQRGLELSLDIYGSVKEDC